MQASDLPARFAIPFAKNADAAFIRPIPVDTVTEGAASLDQGFPAITFTPPGAGGIPPNGKDFNGIFNQTSAWNWWQAAGGPVGYDATFSSENGGYPKGAVLCASTPGWAWQSTADNNTSNPDAGGANWTLIQYDTTGVLRCPTYSAAEATHVPASVNAIDLLGYATLGDLGAARYVRSTGDYQLTTADGAHWLLVEPIANPYMLGAVGNGVADDTVPLQNFISFCQVYNVLGLLNGFFKTTSPISITARIKILGNGTAKASLLPGNHSGIVINTSEQVDLSSFVISYLVTPTNINTAGIVKTSPSGQESLGDRFDNIEIFNAYQCMSIDRANLWTMDRCIFEGAVLDCLVVRNTFNADHGDGSISNSTFGSAPAGAGIRYNSGGGLKVVNSKIFNCEFGIALNLASGAFTSDLLVSNASIENVTYALFFSRLGTIGTFSNIQINNCEWESDFGTVVTQDVNEAWVINLSCSDNVWLANPVVGIMYDIHSASNVSILGGCAQSQTSGTKKINIGADVTNGVAGLITGSGPLVASTNAGMNITTLALF